MRRAVVTLAALAAAFATGTRHVRAQARGPSHAEIREDGMHIPSTGRRDRMELAMEEASERAEADRIALRDPAERARRFAELEAILRRVPGRFRIEGRIERPTGQWEKTGGDVKGIADCSAVGGSIGLNCIINASWPVVDGATGGAPPGPGDAIPSKPPSEQLDAMHPAVLFIGLNIDPPGLRAMMVTADTMAFNWVGHLQDGGVNLTRPDRCWTDVRCYRTFRLSAGPEGTTVSIELRAGIYTLSFVLHPDPEATPTKPMKTLN